MWDIRYRPKSFSEVLGQEGNVELLKSRLRKGTTFDTSYIFAGGHGQGKTTLARIYARAMLCLNLNQEDPEPCNECDNCWLYCPEGAISRVNGGYSIDLNYCKGCGICVQECPRGVISLVQEES